MIHRTKSKIDGLYCIKRRNKRGKISELPLSDDGYFYGDDFFYAKDLKDALEEISFEFGIPKSDLVVFEQVWFEISSNEVSKLCK